MWRVTDWLTWWVALEPAHMFLLATPFVVAAAALVLDWLHHR